MERIVSNVSSLADGRHPNRYRPGGRARSATTARKRRRRRLRVTALPTARLMAKATRTRSSAGVVRCAHQKGSIRIRRPSRRSRSKSVRDRIGPITPRGVPGPCRGVTSGRRVRRACSSERESRASWIDGVHWVGRYASRDTPWLQWHRAGNGIGRCSRQLVQPSPTGPVGPSRVVDSRGYGRALPCPNTRHSRPLEVPSVTKLSTSGAPASNRSNHNDVTFHRPVVFRVSPAYRRISGEFSTGSQPDNVPSSVLDPVIIHTLWTTLWITARFLPCL